MAGFGDGEGGVTEEFKTHEQHALAKWLHDHEHDELVAARGKAVTKASKFEGSKPGWAFRLGCKGLGYYRDAGGPAIGFPLDDERAKAVNIPAMPLKLDFLLSFPASAFVSGEHLQLRQSPKQPCTAKPSTALTTNVTNRPAVSRLGPTVAAMYAAASTAAAAASNNAPPHRLHQTMRPPLLADTASTAMTPQARSFRPGNQWHQIQQSLLPAWMHPNVIRHRAPGNVRTVRLA